MDIICHNCNAKTQNLVSINKKSMKCNVPRRQVSGGKKFVVKACRGGKEKIVRFGDANMSIKKSNPARKKGAPPWVGEPQHPPAHWG